MIMVIGQSKSHYIFFVVFFSRNLAGDNNITLDALHTLHHDNSPVFTKIWTKTSMSHLLFLSFWFHNWVSSSFSFLHARHHPLLDDAIVVNFQVWKIISVAFLMKFRTLSNYWNVTAARKFFRMSISDAEFLDLGMPINNCKVHMFFFHAASSLSSPLKNVENVLFNLNLASIQILVINEHWMNPHIQSA